MATKLIKQSGLNVPIRMAPRARSYLLPIILLVSLIAASQLLVHVDWFDFVMIFLALLLIGMGAPILAVIYWRSHRYGLLEFSSHGVRYGLYRLDLDWHDIGPAWTGGTPRARIAWFIVRRASKYKPMGSRIDRWLFERTINRRPSETFAALGAQFQPCTLGPKSTALLDKMRREQLHAHDVIALPIPLLWFSLSGKEAIEIINTVVLKLAGQSPTH